MSIGVIIFAILGDMVKEEEKLFIRKKIKALFLWRDVSMSKVVRKLNKLGGNNLSVSNLSHKLKKNTVKFKEVLEIADLLGYDVVFKPKPDWEDWEE